MSAEKKTLPGASVATANPKKRKPRKKRVGWFENFRQQWMGMITGIVFSLIIFLIFPPVVRFFFPTAGTIDIGKLMKLPLAILCLYIINFTVQVILKRQWKVLAGYLNPNYDGIDWGDDFARANSTTRLWISTIKILADSLVVALLLL